MSTLSRRLAAARAHEIAFVEAETQWVQTARAKQILPLEDWSLAVAMSGRGFGKTLMGASWVRRCAGLYPGCVIHVVAPTYGDLRAVVFHGSTGLLNVIPHAMIKRVNNSTFEIEFWNGSIVRGFSAESPDRLRGPQCTFLWGDEIASWGHTAVETLTNIDMSTRVVYRHGRKRIQPQRFYTTTPRPLAWLKKMIERKDAYTIVRTGSTYENRANLAESFLREVEQYEGTVIGRQELHGELIDLGEGAVIKRAWLKLWPHDRPLPWFDFLYVSMDTALTEKAFDKKDLEPNWTACTVWGVFPFEKRWNMMLLECWHDRIGMPELILRAKRELRAVYGRRREVIFKPLIGSTLEFEQVKKPDLLIIEDKGSGISLRQVLQNEGIDSWPYDPGRADKLARLHAGSHVAAAGRIWLPESRKNPGEPRDWVEDMLAEVCVYAGPGTTRYDDFVDSYSQAVRYFADRWLQSGVNEKIKDENQESEIEQLGGQIVDDRFVPIDQRNPYD